MNEGDLAKLQERNTENCRTELLILRGDYPAPQPPREHSARSSYWMLLLENYLTKRRSISMAQWLPNRAATAAFELHPAGSPAEHHPPVASRGWCHPRAAPEENRSRSSR